MPPCGFNQKAVRGALQFIQGCYEDLQAEVESGKYATIEEAIEAELQNLEGALSQLHINEEGKLVPKDSS